MPRYITIPEPELLEGAFTVNPETKEQVEVYCTFWSLHVDSVWQAPEWLESEEKADIQRFMRALFRDKDPGTTVEAPERYFDIYQKIALKAPLAVPPTHPWHGAITIARPQLLRCIINPPFKPPEEAAAA